MIQRRATNSDIISIFIPVHGYKRHLQIKYLCNNNKNSLTSSQTYSVLAYDSSASRHERRERVSVVVLPFSGASGQATQLWISSKDSAGTCNQKGCVSWFWSCAIFRRKQSDNHKSIFFSYVVGLIEHIFISRVNDGKGNFYHYYQHDIC